MRLRLYLVLVVTGLAYGVRSATYHVGPSGNDGNTGLAEGQAFATIQRGADAALAGDSVVVHAGTYAGFAAMDHSGTPAAPIVFFALEGVVIDEPCSYNDQDGINVENVSWVVVEGFRVEGMPRTGIRSALSDHVSIRRNVCTANYKWGILTGYAEHVLIELNECSYSEDEHGIYFSNSADDPIIRNNHCHHNRANGIHMNGDAELEGDGIISNAFVYGNIIHDNGVGGGSGINCDGVIDSFFYNNLIHDNHASGISLYRIDGGAPSTNNTVYHNTIVNPSDARWCINITAECTGNRVLNNILINQHAFRGSISCDATALEDFVSDHNLVIGRFTTTDGDDILTLAEWQALGHDTHSAIAQPVGQLFASPATGDFHAASAGAQMVDAGSAAVSTVVVMDLDGVARPQGAGYDIGCYERSIVTGLEEARPSSSLLTWSDGTLRVRNAPAGSSVAWCDATGRAVAPAQRTTADLDLVLPGIAWSMAVLRAADGSVLAVQRVVR